MRFVQMDQSKSKGANADPQKEIKSALERLMADGLGARCTVDHLQYRYALKELAAVFGRVEMELLASSLRVASSFVESILRHQALRDPEN